MDGISHSRTTAIRVALALVLALVATLAGGAAGERAFAAAVPAGSPFGNVESVRAVTGGIAVAGWAIDPDTAAPIYVWVTLDGAGRHLHANQRRPDVAAAYPTAGPDHGFTGTLSAAPGSHTVCVTASNVGAGAHTPLGCWNVRVSAAGSPFGNVESVRAVAGAIAVKGWAIDPDTAAPIYVWATLDGAGRHLYANQPRPDVAAAYPGAGPDHGFTGTLSAAPGSHTVCVTASNVGAGAHTPLGCWTLGVAAPSSAQVATAQSILTKLGIPVGPVDGAWGAQTAQGMCTFRLIAGLPVSRGGLTADDVARLNAYSAAYASLGSIPAPARGGRSTYLVATRTCQTMLYARDGHYVRTMRISTGKPGYATPTGAYLLGRTQPGWSCSSLYPEACYYRSEGVNALYATKGVPYSTYGNMYNKRTISGAYMLHGSPSVPTYPASHGCVRVTIADSDWMFGSISNSAGVVYLEIVGTY